MGSGRNRLRSETLRAAILFVAAVGVAGCGGAERDAARALDRALADPSRPPAEIRADLERIVATWPETPAARRARRELESAGAIDRALARGLSLRAWDAVRSVARAVERYRARHGRLPDDLQDLLPGLLDERPLDPWGRPVVYTRRGRDYLVVSYGSDGLPGGSGEARDFVVESGRIRRD